MPIEVQIGFLAETLELNAGDVTINTLPGLDAKEDALRSTGLVEDDWVYAPRQTQQDMLSGATRELPFPSRVFGLCATHIVRHNTANDLERLRFLVWVLSFMTWARLTDSDPGFLDATPIKGGRLHDIVWLTGSKEKGLAIADDFWIRHGANPRICKGLASVIHSFLISGTPTLLEFERFIYLYIAIDGCHAVWSRMNGKDPVALAHGKRIENLCNVLSRPIPDWADNALGLNAVRPNRNDALHEGLFFDEPLGFQIYGGNSRSSQSSRNFLLEMRCFVSRTICGLLGFSDINYIKSPLDTRQRYGIKF